jgi:hypothetical protein
MYAQISSAQTHLLRPRTVRASSITEAGFRHENLHHSVHAGISTRGWALRQAPTLTKQVEQRLCLFQVGRAEAFGEPAVHRCEDIAGFGAAALVAM